MLKNFKTYQNAVVLYKKCEKLKCNRHLYDQIVRASSSIVLNLSEGSARPTPKDRRRYYFIAMSSLRETQAVLDLLELRPDQAEIGEIADTLGGQIYKLCDSIKTET